MSMSNKEIVTEFIDGAESGSACNMDITADAEGNTYLWDYEWALLAFRASDGELWVYRGWHGYSKTTSSHVNLLDPERYSEKYSKRGYKPEESPVEIRVVGKEDGMSMDVETGIGGPHIHVVDARPELEFGQLESAGRPELAERDPAQP